ncbi:MAG: F0F1 ATP synthase subunit alpha [Desulfurivibrionaceae bacterium]
MLEKTRKNQEKAFSEALSSHQARVSLEDTGYITSITGPIAWASGLGSVGFEELVEFEDGTRALVAYLEAHSAGLILLDPSAHIRAGMEVKRLRRVVDIGTGPDLIGRVFTASGEVLDNKGPLNTDRRLPIERPAPAIMDRDPVTSPLETGIKVIDTLIPVGKGQRELILGDRQTGKTAIGLDTIANQKNKDVICIYVAVGQRESAMARVIHELEENGAMAYTIILVAGGEKGPGLQYITPYAATSLAESFMEQGKDVLIIYDDLTRHARAYRELSLLLEHPPGREAFPGDIFYIHSRLLERSTHLRPELGGGSLTALPIIETEEQNLSAYIPTNLISITDGQIYLSPELFSKGMLPAIDVGRSVSRVGGKAQRPAFKGLVGELKLSYSQFEELESFSRFATRLDEKTRQALERGRRLRELLRQHRYSPRKDYEQVVTMLALIRGLFDRVSLEKTAEAEEEIRRALESEAEEIITSVSGDQELTDKQQNRLVELCRRALEDAGLVDSGDQQD